MAEPLVHRRLLASTPACEYYGLADPSPDPTGPLVVTLHLTDLTGEATCPLCRKALLRDPAT